MNETVSLYPDILDQSDLFVSKPTTNGVSKENSHLRNGAKVHGDSSKIEYADTSTTISAAAVFKNSTRRLKYNSVLIQAEELVNKNGAKEAFYSQNFLNDTENIVADRYRNLSSEDSSAHNITNPDPQPAKKQSKRGLWSRRHARTLEEGIRRETAPELYTLLNDAQIEARTNQGRRYVERSFMGLINALAEEHEDLDIDINTVENTPLWKKEVNEVRINFSRLGFKPIRMGGNEIQAEGEEDVGFSLVDSADDAFDLIDKDKSGTLDRDELAEALSTISDLETDKKSVQELASKLVDIYDFDGDGAVDREEYQQMVEDMAKLNPEPEEIDKEGPLNAMKKSVRTISRGVAKTAAQAAEKAKEAAGSAAEKAAKVASAARGNPRDKEPEQPPAKEYGSIVLSNLKLDLRRLLFGGVPLIKRVSCYEGGWNIDK
jgi:hypothetical protein